MRTWMVATIIGSMGFAALPNKEVNAQCGTTVCHKKVVVQDHVVQVAPVVAVAVPVPVLVPAFSFQYIPALQAATQQPATQAASQPNQEPAQAPQHREQEKQQDDGPPVAIFEGDVKPIAKVNRFGNQAISYLQANCASCHSGPGKGGVSIFDTQGRYSPNVAKAEIVDAIVSQRMPKGVGIAKASQTDVTMLKNWLAE